MTEGPLTKKVRDYADTMARVVSGSPAPDDWSRVAEFVAVDGFERIGPFLEVQDWQQCVEMLSAWAGSVDRFETSVRRITEQGNLVYFQVEERHFVGDQTMKVNSLSVFEFNEAGKICHLDVFLQKAS